MGVNLSEIVPSHEISMDSLNGKILAVDAMNTLYQFLTVIRQPDGTPLKDSRGNITSHLSGLFYRTINWMEKGIKPVFIFDGIPPDLKKKENLERKERREKAYEEYLKLKEEGKLKEAFVKAIQSAKLTEEMVDSAKELLEAMGLPYIQAISEGEAQAAYMNRINKVQGVISQDYDSLIFRGKTLIKNLSIVGKRKVPKKDLYVEIKPEKIELDEVLNYLNINHEKLIWIAILVGTDYNPGGIKGIGPKKALELVKKFNSFEELMENVEWEHENDPYEILNFFKNPPVRDENFEFKSPDPDRIIKVLVEKHDFSEERVKSYCEKLLNLRKSRQSSLFGFSR